uniref:Uncharacterized protein n=1 Tax=Ascaris lumbricoides TaxID=6252 RepID=A0A0M3IX49_ASCLU
MNSAVLPTTNKQTVTLLFCIAAHASLLEFQAFSRERSTFSIA